MIQQQDEDMLAGLEVPMVSDHSQPIKQVRRLQAALRQISEVIDDETQALGSHAQPDFQDIMAKKARGLQALSLLLDEIKTTMLSESCKADIQDRLDQLHGKLARNQQVLQIHMEAVEELVEMIHSAAQAQETDGTYDPFCMAKPTTRKQSQKQPLHEDQSL